MNRRTTLRERREEQVSDLAVSKATEFLQGTQRGMELVYKLEDTLCLLKQHIRAQNRLARALAGSACMEQDA